MKHNETNEVYERSNAKANETDELETVTHGDNAAAAVLQPQLTSAHLTSRDNHPSTRDEWYLDLRVA
jgi:hypothetical protein